MSTEAFAVVNPVAGGGRVGATWSTLSEALRQAGLQFQAQLTGRPGDGTPITRKAIAEGFRHIICVGGDGTVNEVVNGLVLDGRIPSDVVLSILPQGTGSDFGRAMNIPRVTAEAVRLAASGRTRVVDIALIRCLRDGQPVERYFVNVAGVGFDGDTCVRVNRMSKRLGGTIPYLTGLVMSLISYQNKPTVVTHDGQRVRGKYNSVVVCNGQYFGGGMWVGPRAAADDGLLDVVILGDLNKVELLLNLPRVYRGTHLTHPKVSTFRTRHVRIESEGRMYLEAEGELVGETPAELSILRSALTIHG